MATAQTGGWEDNNLPAEKFIIRPKAGLGAVHLGVQLDRAANTLLRSSLVACPPSAIHHGNEIDTAQHLPRQPSPVLPTPPPTATNPIPGGHRHHFRPCTTAIVPAQQETPIVSLTNILIHLSAGSPGQVQITHSGFCCSHHDQHTPHTAPRPNNRLPTQHNPVAGCAAHTATGRSNKQP
ncbi:hypothetical protein CCHOA_08400 [Corynebacterium choanae]|uniref:Uncharacterized protein n=1 Tax=Corynebacterium choanae TaxID=1862358 RepID=A0A3G6J839_9CORY|nr:hypothetical protein CCHOA_08400 [Corynebacterium choanae]